MLQENLASALNKILKERGISRVELCEILGMPSSTIYPILQGKGNPQLNTVEKIAQRLRVGVIDLLTGFQPEVQQEVLSSILEKTLHLPEQQRQDAAFNLKNLLDLFAEET